MSEIKPRRRRWLLGGLVASLAVNMFLIGWMVGAAPRGGPFAIWSWGAGSTRRRRAGCAPVWARRAWTVSPSIGGAIAPK